MFHRGGLKRFPDQRADPGRHRGRRKNLIAEER
jgi:hypothetical protein